MYFTFTLSSPRVGNSSWTPLALFEEIDGHCDRNAIVSLTEYLRNWAWDDCYMILHLCTKGNINIGNSPREIVLNEQV